MGVAAGVFLEEYAPPGRLRRIIQTNIANLAGVPSIVYGILGWPCSSGRSGSRPWRWGRRSVAGGADAQPADLADHRDHHPGSPADRAQLAPPGGAGAGSDPLADGLATMCFPRRLPGIMTGTILGLSRAIGETAPLLMVGAAGSIRKLPKGPIDRYTALPVEIYNYAKEPDRMFQTVSAGRHPAPADPLALDERRRHRDSQPVPALPVRRCHEALSAHPMTDHEHDRIPRRRRSPRPLPLAPPPDAAAPDRPVHPRTLSVWYGPSLALKDITIDIPATRSRR